MQKSGLIGTLSGFSGTVFAPTDSAFNNLLGLLDLSKEMFFGGNTQVIEQVSWGQIDTCLTNLLFGWVLISDYLSVYTALEDPRGTR